MTKNKSLLLGVIAAVALTTTAQAADKNFEGFYAGAELGYNNINLGNTSNSGGLYYGGMAGYRIQMPSNLVLGLEARFGDSTATEMVGFGETNVEISAGRQLGVDAIFGYAMGDNKDVLAYGFLGYTNAKVTGSALGANTSATGDGLRFGLGAEYVLTDNMSLRVTGAYADYSGSLRDWQLNSGIVFRF